MRGFFGHLLALPYRFFEQRTTGDLMMRLGSNAQVREMLTSQTLSVVIDGSLVVVYLGVPAGAGARLRGHRAGGGGGAGRAAARVAAA